MSETSSREALWGEEVAIFDFLAQTMTTEQWAGWLKAPLEVAAAHGDVRLSQKLVVAGAEVGNALHKAIGGRHKEIVINLVENAAVDIDVTDENNMTPLHVALTCTPLNTTGFLRVTGPLPEHYFQPGSVWCEAVVRLLLRKGADPNIIGSRGTPLQYACSHYNLGAAKALLEAGADFSIRADSIFEKSRSAVDTAAGIGVFDILRVLIEQGADVTAAGPDGDTPLHHAGYSNFAEVADVLIEAAANVEARGADNTTPLHIASSVLRATMVRAFIKHGANVNGRCRFGRTPLHEAASTAISDEFRREEAADVVDLSAVAIGCRRDSG